MPTTTLPPFLRWAGGKRWLAKQLPDLVGDLAVERYHEPFLGGGSIFLSLRPTGKAHLSDLNAELVETYVQVRDHAPEVAEALALHVNTEEHYYKVRASQPTDPTHRAARFIFLNHTSFNGIHRVNLKGVYNVPYGHRPRPNIPTREQLEGVASALAGCEIRTADFQSSISDVQPGDLVFLDPPYTVAHNNNGFVKYNQKLFSFDDQHRLSAVVDQIRDREAFYILTNAAHPSIKELFDKGDRLIVTRRRNVIGGREALRGGASEYLFTNVADS